MVRKKQQLAPQRRAVWRTFSVHHFFHRRCGILATSAFCRRKNLNAVERAFDIVIQPAVHAFYTTQFAGDMHAQFADEKLTLLQTWSEDDFRRVQENLIGHLVTQKRLKLSPTLFIATQDNELDVISVCNLSGEVCKETLGTRKRTVLADSLAEFLTQLKPVL